MIDDIMTKPINTLRIFMDNIYVIIAIIWLCFFITWHYHGISGFTFLIITGVGILLECGIYGGKIIFEKYIKPKI